MEQKVHSVEVDNIPKILIKDLIKDMLLQSSILAFVDFKDLMISNPNFSYFEVMSRLIRIALETHERVCPLYKRSRLYLAENTYTFRDTFDAFLECKIKEDFVTLIPKTTPYSLDTSLLHTRRSWLYERPILKNVHNLGLTEIDYITSYPVRMAEHKENKDFTDNSAIYYIDMYGGKTEDAMFKRQFYLQVLTYLKGVKNNLRYPDMPLELLQGIEEEYSLLSQELQEFYRKSATHGRLYR